MTTDPFLFKVGMPLKVIVVQSQVLHVYSHLFLVHVNFPWMGITAQTNVMEMYFGLLLHLCLKLQIWIHTPFYHVASYF